MNIRFKTWIAVVMVGLGFPSDRVQAQLYTVETEFLRLIYSKGSHGFIMPHTVRCFENALAFHRELFDYTPTEKISVLLHDQSDFANAGATTSPRNAVIVAIAPFSYVYETTPANERINLIMSHELVHIVAADRGSSRERFFRGLFGGKVRENKTHPESMIYGYLTSPRRSAPRWFHEGVAVFMETWMAGGYGRAQGAYDEMVFRAKVRDGSHFYDPVGLEAQGTKVDFMGGVNSYLYGTRFVSYVAYEYGVDKVREWIPQTEGAPSYFASQFKKIFGLSVDDAWSDWIVWEHAFQTRNLDSVRHYPITPHRDILSMALGSVSKMHYDSTHQQLFLAVNYPGKLAHIAVIDLKTGEMRKLCDVKGASMYYVTSLAYDAGSRTLFYTTDNYEWRDLRCVNVDTRKSRTLIKNVRMGDLVYNPSDSSIWGVRHYNGISTLARVAYPWNEWDQIFSWPYGKDMYDLDISPDGSMLSASLAEISGRQTLITMNLEQLEEGVPLHRELFDFRNSIPESFSFSPDGRYLYGSSYYTGVSNIWRYDFEADSMEAMTNCEDGLFRPVPVWPDSVIALRYTGEGFVPTVVPTRPLEDVSATTFLGQLIAEKYPVVRSWSLGPPSAIKLSEVITDSGVYNGLANTGLTSIYPVVEGYKDFVAYGLHAQLSDPILRHQFELTASYSPNETVPTGERLHLRGQWIHGPWSLSASHNGADFYDLFGPSRRSRKGNSLSLGYSQTLISDAPKSLGYTLSLAGYNNMEELPFFQDIPTTFDKFATLGFDVNYGNKRASLGAVDYTKGVGMRLISSNTFVKDRTYAQVIGNLDLGVPFIFKHSSLWLRTSAGGSTGDRTDPQANLYFGGFRNNYVDFRTEKRYRKFYTFPGAPINSIGGTNYAKALIELNMPPLRFSRVGSSSMYAERIRMALFASGLMTQVNDKNERRELGNVGAQLEFRFMLLSHYRMTFSVGYATAFEKSQDRTDEWMWSLRIL